MIIKLIVKPLTTGRGSLSQNKPENVRPVDLRSKMVLVTMV